MQARQWLLGQKWKALLLGLFLSATVAATWLIGSNGPNAAGALDRGTNWRYDDNGVRPSAPRAQTRKTPTTPTPRGCWIFTHMNKSGGSTIKAMLAKHTRRIGGSFRIYSQLLYGEGEERLREFLSQSTTVVAGGYTEAFRPFRGGKDCKWFTMFRHPVSRVISAYLYCKSEPSELLCGNAVLKANETDIYTFAEHWGNFGLRQFALAFVPQDVLLSTEVQQGLCTPECPAWYRAKLYFEGLQLQLAESARPAKPADEADPLAAGGAMANLVEPVKDLLSTRYAAVGILEEWEKSMMLFDHALELPKYSWSRSPSQSRAKNKGRATFQNEKDELLRTAWTDERLKKSILLDLLLYEHAIGVFQQQLKDYGLTE